jgi:hypothetical protein
MNYKVGDRVAYTFSKGGESYVGQYRDKNGSPGVAEVLRQTVMGVDGVMVSGPKKGLSVCFWESEIEPSMKIVAVKRGLSDFAVKLFGKVQGESGKIYSFGYIRTSAFRGWVCSCNDFIHQRSQKNQNCKHLHFVRGQLGRYGVNVK